MYQKLSDVSIEDAEKRLSLFLEDSKRKRSAVVCVNCGSTVIDQNCLSQLRCYNCGAVSTWNGFRFTISRSVSEAVDFPTALKTLMNSSYDDWHKQLEDAMATFLGEVVGDAITSEKFSSDRLEKLKSDWETCKKTVDMHFQDRRIN